MDEQEERIVNVAYGLEGVLVFVQEEQITDNVENGLGSELTFVQMEEHVVNVEDGLMDEPAFVQEENTDNGAEDSSSESASVDEVHLAFLNSLEYSPYFLDEQTIYPAPLCLKNDNTVSFYHPKEISFGPQHHGFRPQHFKTEVDYGGLELFKSEVAGEFHKRLRDKDDSLMLLVEMLNSEENKREIEKSYGRSDKMDFSLAWLLVRDGCFVLKVLDGFSVKGPPPETENGPKTVLHHILNRFNHHPLLNDIVKDMFKLENQLPLLVLKEIKKRLEGKLDDYWFESALENLSPVEVREEIGCREYRREIHLLQLLGEYMVDNEKSSLQAAKAIVEVGSHKNRGKYIITGLIVIFFVLLCISLSPVFIIWFLWLVISLLWESYQYYKWGEADMDARHVPTIEELYKIGVKFKKLKHKGISHIRFDENQSTLYLPKFTVDDKSEVILRNLLVLETHWDDPQKIITRYVVLMNDLLNTSEDVSRLRQEGIISNKLGSDEDVARLWNSVTIPATDIPSYEPIDTAAKRINAYREERVKIVWAQFRNLHCSKPWLVASLLGGITVLALTGVQVVCLFYHCEKG